MPEDITPKNFIVIPSKDKIQVFDGESDPSGGLVPRVGGAGGVEASKVKSVTKAVAGSFDANGNFIKDLINGRLDTQTKTILGDFTFGESGAIKIITDEDNGIWISPAGIFSKKNGITTMAITNNGDATFAGNLSAASGTLGTITTALIDIGSSGYIRGGQTAFRTGSGVFLGYDTTPELEQWHYATTSPQDYTWANGTISKVGQTFPLTSGSATIKKIVVKLKVNSPGTTSTITCDIYAINSSWLPTGDSLGQASIAGISNTDYENKEFIFDTPVSLSANTQYAFVLSASSTSPSISIYKGMYWEGGRQIYYTTSWQATSEDDLWFELYHFASDYKLSVGNSDYELSYNGANIKINNEILVRNKNLSHSYCSYSSSGLTKYSSGYSTFWATENGLSWSILKSQTKGLQLQARIEPYFSMSNDNVNYAGITITDGKGGINYGSVIIYHDDTSGPKIDATAGTLFIGTARTVQIGNSSYKATVYADSLSSCPLPTVDNALSLLDKMGRAKTKSELKNPELAHFEYKEATKKRKYFDIDDLPAECQFENSEGKKDIDIIRTTGFLLKAIKELNEKVDEINSKLK